ncbi:DUF4023 family protein [Paenibacillus sacheonensis]|uniref:DUF4023 domain-containing protein n=1 Tax=Paenibacillus sacheonensis TaxID=742054 RepID=A0A7X5C1L8_9BACL|nr:DUF4023 family protein [Paenibacillus sacheonensis]MBM7566217.1 hypothetical protein [Paenibacillus sacheonensis]NBC70425.1 DUF4023 domain-containing protein [Paenibacillus sacheonensis]
MESTNEFVKKFNETQAKQRKNHESGKGKPSKSLQNVQHTNNP